MGRSYTPMTELSEYRERGVATWYGRRYHGQRTSSGEVYDMYAMTGAHTLLPIPSYARVTNLANGRSVVVRINDRGPFLADRLIDLSFVAAHKLDIVRNGSALVEVEAVLPQTDAVPSYADTAPVSAAPAIATAMREPKAPSLGDEVTAPRAAAGDHFLQLAAFSVLENAERFVERVRTQLNGSDAQLRIVSTGSVYRVQAGPYANRAAALQAADGIGQMLGAAPIVAVPR
jgi:rare lipoprotein A